MTNPNSPAAAQALRSVVEDAVNAYARTMPEGRVHPKALLAALATVAANLIAQCQEMADQNRAGPDDDGVLVRASQFFFTRFSEALCHMSGYTVRCETDEASAPAGQGPH